MLVGGMADRVAPEEVLTAQIVLGAVGFVGGLLVGDGFPDRAKRCWS